jgi:manganese/zinc/iron transport system permease protein
MNPYWGQHFIGFIQTFLLRIIGRLPQDTLPSDEIQLLVLSGVSVASALIGTFLVLKRMTMLANSLSHTILLGIVLVSLAFSSNSFQLDLKMLLLASLVSALLTVFLTQLLTHTLRLQEDVSIGLVFTTLFALGVTLVTVYTKNTHIGTEAIMGNADALHPDDISLSWTVGFINLIFTFVFYRGLKILCFDEALAKSLGFYTFSLNSLLMILTAATCIGAFRAVGVFLVLAFLVGPPLTARIWTHRLKYLLPLSCAIGCAASFTGVALTRHFLSVYQMPLSTGGMVVVVIGTFYAASTLKHLKFWPTTSIQKGTPDKL